MPDDSLCPTGRIFSINEIETFLRKESPLFRLVDRAIAKRMPQLIKSALYRTHRTLVQQGAVVFLAKHNFEFTRDTQGNLRIGSPENPKQWRLVPDHARRQCFPWT